MVRKEGHTQSTFRRCVELPDHGCLTEGGSTVASLFSSPGDRMGVGKEQEISCCSSVPMKTAPINLENRWYMCKEDPSVLYLCGFSDALLEYL